jgi:Acyl-CoA thioesterase N-terminal domain/Acyl-CoA thioesterase C-terminal domain
VDFTHATRIEPLAEGRYRWDVPDGWQQGRGAFGGLVLGALLRAIERHSADPTRATRTLTGDLCGPILPGPAEIVVELLRRGNNLSNLDARLIQSGAIQARASAVLSAAKVAVHVPTPRPPTAPPSTELAITPLGPPEAPVFAPHFEYRSASPNLFAGADGAATLGWLRLRDAPARLDAPAMIGLLDAWWPALFSGGPRPVATVSFTAELLVDPTSLPADVPLLYTGRVAALSDGFCVEFRELWSGDRLVALNQQTFAVLK